MKISTSVFNCSLLLFLVAIAGCAVPQRGPEWYGASAKGLDRDLDECEYETPASADANMFYAAAMNKDAFDRCMRLRGWRRSR